MTNWFTELSAIDVSDHIKQKNGKRYLGWMWAWSELKKRYPLSYATVHETPDGMLVWKDPIGCHVKTSVTIVFDDNGVEREHTVYEYLPCMNPKNQAIAYDEVDAMVVNKTVQRSLTKCIARLGLGGYIFANEDLPEDVARANDLREEIESLVKKKVSLSDTAKAKVAELCKAAEKDAFPGLDDSAITGNYKFIEDVDVLEKLKKQLMAVRK